MAKIIGLNGFKGAGKDAVGSILIESAGYTLAKFAALLYQSTAGLYGVTVEQLDEWKNDPTVRFQIVRLPNVGVDYGQTIVDLSGREILQRNGTQGHREVFGSEFWIEQCLKRLSVGGTYVFTDARFDNELEAVRLLGGKNIRIERPGLEGSADTHESEALPNPELIDAVLYNDGTLEDLPGKVAGLIGALT